MTGGDIIAALLRADQASAAFFAATNLDVANQVKLGRFPDNVALSAWLVRTVSSVDRQPLKRVGYIRVTDRVSVTVRAASYRDQKTSIALIRSCCAGKMGDIGGGLRVSILTGGKGPDLAGPGNSFEQAQDLLVSFDDPV